MIHAASLTIHATVVRNPPDFSDKLYGRLEVADTVKNAVCDDEKNISAQKAEQRKKELVIRYAGEKRAIPFCDIYYMESQNHSIVLNMKSGKLKYYGKIGDLEEELAGQFYRIHRGYLVNLSHVQSYDKAEVRMANGDKLLISRYKYAGFVQAYMDYISEE